MVILDAPQWLLSAWQRAVTDAGATAAPALIAETGERLLDRWQEPGRHFHNLRHLADVLAKVDELSPEAHSPHLVQLAAWYHGVVFSAAGDAAYAHRGGEDEEASADLAYSELSDLGVADDNARRVHDLVLALARHAADGSDMDSAVLCDADLAVLAVEPQRYRTYLEDVRAEYAHIPQRDFLEARSAILARILARPSVFVTPLAQPWEEPARQNLGAEQQRVTKELARLDAESPREDE
ncbi:MAG: hypothetical protein M3Y20_00665 [Actinomycetota bacterium]|nr:hypothetical protein [Actinomycetota bacterium]